MENTQLEICILEVLEESGDFCSVDMILEKVPNSATRSQVNSALSNLEKRARVFKSKKGTTWSIGNESLEKRYLKALKEPKKAVDLVIVLDESVSQVNKVLYSLECSKLVKRTVSNPPIWSLCDRKDELMRSILKKLEEMDEKSLEDVLERLG